MPVAPLRWLALALLALGMAAGVAPAGAHTALVATDPATDSALPAGPARVTAVFNEELQPAFGAMAVVGPDGNIWSDGDAEVLGATAAVALRPLGPAGRYTVNYRVTSADGHVVTGSWSFTVAVAGAGQPGPAVEPPMGQPGAPAAGPGRMPLWPFGVGAVVLAAGWLLARRVNRSRRGRGG